MNEDPRNALIVELCQRLLYLMDPNGTEYADIKLFKETYEMLMDYSPTSSECDCHLRERQVCDICQGIAASGGRKETT